MILRFVGHSLVWDIHLSITLFHSNRARFRQITSNMRWLGVGLAHVKSQVLLGLLGVTAECDPPPSTSSIHVWLAAQTRPFKTLNFVFSTRASKIDHDIDDFFFYCERCLELAAPYVFPFTLNEEAAVLSSFDTTDEKTQWKCPLRYLMTQAKLQIPSHHRASQVI